MFIDTSTTVIGGKFMSILVRRGLAAVLAAVLIAVTALVLPAAQAQPAAAQTPNFYTPPAPLPAGRDGDIVKSENINYFGASTARRIMYLSRDVRNQPMAVTGTVLVPSTAWTGTGPRPIVAYAPFTAGMGDQCAPSKLIAGEVWGDLVTGVQTAFVNALLQKGIAVAQTDYQGMGTPGDHTYVIRLAQAHAVLDVIRAAQRLPGIGLPTNGPVGIAGYSQGGGASAAAAELEPTYAPELDLKGAYVGAPPADLAAMATSLDGSFYVGFLGFAVLGNNAAYPELNILGRTNATGRAFLTEANGTCTLDAVFRYGFRTSNTMTVDGRPIAAHMNEEPFRSVVASNKLGTIRPMAPTVVESGVFDDVVPYAQAKQLGKDWCAQGATVQWNDILNFIPIFAHLFSGTTSATNAANWLNQRFTGVPATSNCGLF